MKVLGLITAAILSLPLAGFAGPADDATVLLNEIRNSNGRNDLAVSPRLMKAAQAHADDMVRQNYFSHRGKNGSKISTRVKAQGFKGCYYAENIAQGQKTAQAVMKSWMASSGHRKNNLTKKATHFGVGFAGGNTWVMVFSKAC